MKFSQTALPLSFDRSIVPPPTWGTTSAGAGWPRWNAVFGSRLPLGPGENGAIDADGKADGDSDSAIDGLADGLDRVDALVAGMRVGDGVGRRPTRSGPANTNAARTPTATSTPVN